MDDFLIVTKSQQARDTLMTKLEKVYGKMKSDSGINIKYRGLQIQRTPTFILVHQQQYAEQLIIDTQTMKTSRTPTSKDLFTIDPTSPLLSPKELSKFVEIMARVSWLSNQTRPDLKLATGFLSRRAQVATQEDARKLSKTLQYINATTTKGIRFTSTPNLHLQAFADASHLTNDDCSGQSGFTLLLAGGSIWTESKKQNIISQSSTEGEIIACNSATNAVVWTRRLLRDIGFAPTKPTTIFQDNLSTITMLEVGRPTSKSRHIKMRYFHVSSQIRNKEITLKYLPTSLMPADLLTKSLDSASFNRHRSVILNEIQETEPDMETTLSSNTNKLELPQDDHGLRGVSEDVKNRKD